MTGGLTPGGDGIPPLPSRRGCGGLLASPANRVTVVRAVLSGAVAVLVTAGIRRGPVARATLPLTVAALVLDAVDGKMARRTHSETAVGARLDGEVDAFLILTLSVQAARAHGRWVLGAGLARYAFAAAGWVLPWLRRPLPPRYWRKVATATEGIALAAALTALPRGLVRTGLAAGSGLIAESFGRDVWWLWRRRGEVSGS